MFVFSLLCCCVIFIRKKSRFCFTFFSSAFLDVRVLHISHLIRKKTRETLKHSIIFSASSLSLSRPFTPSPKLHSNINNNDFSVVKTPRWRFVAGLKDVKLCAPLPSLVLLNEDILIVLHSYNIHAIHVWAGKKNFKARWIEGRNHAIMRSTAVSSVYCASTRALDFSIVKSTLSRVSELCNLHKQPS